MDATLTTSYTREELEILNDKQNRLVDEYFKTLPEPRYPPELHKEWEEKIESRKRFRDDESDHSDGPIEAKKQKQRPNDKTWEKYYVLEPIEKDPAKLKKLHPFMIERYLTHMVGEGTDASRLKSGSWLVEVQNERQAKNIKKLTIIDNISVKVTPHNTMNSKKGVIRSSDLKEMTEDELLKELQDKGVTEVKRIKFKKNGSLHNSNAIILTFGTHTLPEYIKAGFLHLPVSQYIPNPLRCYKCQRYGHHKTNCRGNQSCQVCSEEGHDSRDCNKTAKCRNCEGNHPAYSKDCPAWEQEKKIVKTKVEKNVTFKEARRLCKAGSAAGRVSYAQVVTSAAPPLTRKSTTPKKLVDTQTDMTWPIDSETYHILTTESETQTEEILSPTEQPRTTSTEQPGTIPAGQPAMTSKDKSKDKPAQQTAEKNPTENTFKTVKSKQRNKTGKSMPGPAFTKKKFKEQEVEIEIHHPYLDLADDEEGEDMETAPCQTEAQEPSTDGGG